MSPIAALLTTLVWAQPGPGATPAEGAPGPASRPSSQPAKLERGGTGADLDGQVTFIYELDEQRFRVQESWNLTHRGSKLVDSVTFKMPQGAFRLTLDEDVSGFAANAPGTAFGSTAPIGPGQHTVSGAYFLGFSGDSATVNRRIPVNMVSSRLIFEDIPGVRISANVPQKCEPRDLNGLKFRVCTFERVAAGSPFEVRFKGLPSRSRVPRNFAVLLSVALLAWMLYALYARAATERGPGLVSVVSAQARRDQLLRALEILQEDRAADKISAKKYERRRRELMEQLADVLREIELDRNHD